MIPVHNLFETHLPVTDLDRAVGFYRDVVGLTLAHVASARQAAFFWSISSSTTGGRRPVMRGRQRAASMLPARSAPTRSH
jgi:predicted enzyme related to lactoylglutathione lyase